MWYYFKTFTSVTLNKKDLNDACFTPITSLLIDLTIRLVLIEILQEYRLLKKSNFYKNCEI